MCLQHKNFSIWFYYSFHYTVVENPEKSFICYVIHTVGENHTQLCIQMSLHHFHIIMRKMTIDVEKKHLELHSPHSRMTDHEPIFC